MGFGNITRKQRWAEWAANRDKSSQDKLKGWNDPLFGFGTGENLEEMTNRVTEANARARLAWAQQMESDLKAGRMKTLAGLSHPAADLYRSPEISINQIQREALQGPALDSARVLSMLKGTTTFNYSNNIGSGGGRSARRKTEAGGEESSTKEPTGPRDSGAGGRPQLNTPYEVPEEEQWRKNMREAQEERNRDTGPTPVYTRPTEEQQQERERQGLPPLGRPVDPDEERRRRLRQGFRF